MTQRAEETRPDGGAGEVTERPATFNERWQDPTALYRSLPTMARDQWWMNTALMHVPQAGVEQNGSLWFNANTTSGSAENKPLKFDPKAPPQEQLTAFAAAYERAEKDSNGRAKIKIGEGENAREVLVERQQMGKANLLHVLGTDGHVMMRAVEREGNWEQQRDKRGNQVSWFVTTAARAQDLWWDRRKVATANVRRRATVARTAIAPIQTATVRTPTVTAQFNPLPPTKVRSCGNGTMFA
jgi:hypothetical protein